MIDEKELASWDVAKISRKASQAWEMAGLARQDRDGADEKRWTEEAKQLDAELRKRRQQ